MPQKKTELGTVSAGRFSDRNQAFSSALVKALFERGYSYFLLAPGARSAPLSWACLAHPQLKVETHFDERGMAFQALGFAKATGRAAVVVTTSGSAGANLLPAVLEAYFSCLPILILTANRPPELLHVGANQACRQVGYFGEFVAFARELPVSDVSVPLAYLIGTVREALSYLEGSAGPSPAPVHLDLFFREPLLTEDPSALFKSAPPPEKPPPSTAAKERQPVEVGVSMPAAKPSSQVLSPQAQQELLPLLREKTVLVLMGKIEGYQQTPSFIKNWLKFFSVLKAPVFAEVASGFRFLEADQQREAQLVPYYNFLLQGEKGMSGNRSLPFLFSHETDPPNRTSFSPALVLHFGGCFTSKALFLWLQAVKKQRAQQALPGLSYWHFSERAERFDPFGLVTKSLSVSLIELPIQLRKALQKAAALKSRRPQKKPVANAPFFLPRLVEKLSHFLSTYSFKGFNEAEFARLLCSSGCLPKVALFLGNSMPIREFDFWTTWGTRAAKKKTTLKPVKVFANRGLSGIDGLCATATGVLTGLATALWLVIGDLSALHDLNSLALVAKLHQQQVKKKMGLFIVNNHEGTIFRNLPFAEVFSAHQPFFLHQHRYSFEAFAAAFSLTYYRFSEAAPLQLFLAELAAGRKPLGGFLVEVVIAPEKNQQAQQKFRFAVHRFLRQLQAAL